MNIAAYVDVRRTLLPCTGVGRHANGVLLHLSQRADMAVTLLVGRDQRGADGALPDNAPLRALRQTAVDGSARRSDQMRKLTGLALMDPQLPSSTDFIYSPHDTLIASRKAPVAVTFHDARVFEPALVPRGTAARARHAFMRSWMRRAAAAARIVFTVSAFSKERFVALMGLDPNKVVAVGNGCDPQLFSLEGRPASERTNDIIAIGGLRHLKGGDTLVRLAERLKASGDPATVISVGGPDDERLVAAAERVGNIRRVGFLSDTALAEALGRARALVFLSRYEGFGMPPLEAMALQTPVIASNATALPEVVGDGAIVVDPDDADAAFAALTRLTEDAPWRDDLVARGLAQARRHTWEAVADKVAAALLSAR